MKKSLLTALAGAVSIIAALGTSAAQAGPDKARAEAYFNAISGGNAETIASFYADNAEFFWVGGPLAGTYKGKAKIKGVWEKFGKAAGSLDYKVLELSESLNGKRSTVTARVNFIGPKEVPVKFILVYQEGKIVSEVWQVDKPVSYAGTDTPAPGPAKAEPAERQAAAAPTPPVPGEGDAGEGEQAAPEDAPGDTGQAPEASVNAGAVASAPPADAPQTPDPDEAKAPPAPDAATLAPAAKAATAPAPKTASGAKKKAVKKYTRRDEEDYDDYPEPYYGHYGYSRGYHGYGGHRRYRGHGGYGGY